MKSRSPIILAIIIILLVLGWMFSDDFLSTETKNSFNYLKKRGMKFTSITKNFFDNNHVNLWIND